MKNDRWLSREISFWNLKRAGGLFNLEMLHRLAWRSHGVVLALAVSLAFTMPIRAAEVASAPVDAPKKIEFKLPTPDQDLDKAAGVLKSLDGEVGGKNNYGMAIVYDPDAGKELWINFNNKTKLKGFKKLSELEFEDKIRVIFKETKEGKRLLREIHLLQKKEKEGVLKSIERKFINEKAPQL